MTKRFTAISVIASCGVSGAVGVIFGFIFGSIRTKRKYERQVQSDQEAMLELARSYEKKEEQFNVFRDKVEDLGYSDHAEPPKPERKETERKMDGVKVNGKIYILHPDAYYYDDKYPHEDLVYYEEDDILADGAGEPVEIEDTVTYDALKNIGIYEEDAVYVLNKETGVAYNVVRSSDHFSDIPREWGYDD